MKTFLVAIAAIAVVSFLIFRSHVRRPASQTQTPAPITKETPEVNSPPPEQPPRQVATTTKFAPPNFRGPTSPPHIIGPSGPPPNY